MVEANHDRSARGPDRTMPFEYTTNNDHSTDDGLKLFEHRWLPTSVAPKAVLMLVHGVIEHAGRYEKLGETLAAAGIAVCGHDLRGHGRSEGERVYMRSLKLASADLQRYSERMREEFPDTPLFVMGHSMGGAIVSRWIIERRPDIAGMILSAPAILVGRGALPWFRHVSLVGNILFPRARLVRLGVSGLSRDMKVREAFVKDPLVHHGRFAVRTGVEIIRAGRYIRHRFDQVRVPFLALHGTADRATNPRGTERLFEKSPSPDKTFIRYPEFYHDLIHEPGGDEIIGEIQRWIERRV